MIKYILHTIIILTLSLNALSQTEANAIYSGDSIRIGDQLLLNLSFTCLKTKEDTVDWPEFDNFITNEVEILQKSPIKIDILDSLSQLVQYNQRFVLSSFELGTNPIPAFEIYYNDSVYLTQPHQIYVTSVEVDTSKGIYDIKPIFEVNYKLSHQINDFFNDYWHWIVIFILILAIGFLAYKYAKKPKPEVIVEVPKVPAHITALSILKELSKNKAWENDDKKVYYSSVTDTVRKYLEERFEILAMEETTVEIIKDLKYSDILSKDKFFLQEILQQADMVKFAKFKPDNHDGEIVLEKSIEFVERTKNEEILTKNTSSSNV
ncbi:MAG: hypothetical protein AB8B74_13895 [Crocinitomicaceae bacterium]